MINKTFRITRTAAQKSMSDSKQQKGKRSVIHTGQIISVSFILNGVHLRCLGHLQVGHKIRFRLLLCNFLLHEVQY